MWCLMANSTMTSIVNRERKGCIDANEPLLDYLSLDKLRLTSGVVPK